MTPTAVTATYQAVLLDLDGTLADTALDLANALNNTLTHYGKDALPFSTIRPAVSHGGKALIQLGFGFDEDHTSYAETREYLLTNYSNNIAAHTKLFDGMPTILNYFEKNDIPWGIVTNKPGYLTTPLIKALSLNKRASCVVSGDTVAHSKPHPAPLFHACKTIDVDAKHCIYIGDAERDIEAGRNAGMTTLAAAFGYIDKHDNIEDWGADGIINSALEILDWVKQ